MIEAQYRLLTEGLGVNHARLVMGTSMGGMIAQTFALEHPQRTQSLVSIMSVTGDLAYGTPTEDALAALVAPPPRCTTAQRFWRVWP